MKSNRLVLGALFVLGIIAEATVIASCGGGDSNSGSGGNGAGATNTTGSHAGGGSSNGGGGASTTFAGGTGGGGCTNDKDCKGGVCNMGQCCDSAKDVCGPNCCTGATVCLNETCVTPGKDCVSAADCGADHYCETGLGSSPDDGGVPDAGPDGSSCTQPLPIVGKCLPLPPTCAVDAGAPGPDAGCFPVCEYHPPVGGPLHAVPKWTWGPTAREFPNYTDVWSTPVVGRVHDSNCDGKIDQLDAPVIVFVSGNNFLGAPAGSNCQTATQGSGKPSMCHTGVLRMLDGKTGDEIWSLDKIPGSVGFAGMSVALGDIDGDGKADIVAVTGEGYVVLIDGDGNLLRKSDKPIPGNASATFGWGGGVAIADMDGDGFPEIAFGSTVFSTTNNKITLAWTGAKGIGGGDIQQALSTFVDLDGAADHHLELLAGNTAYKADGTLLWDKSASLPDGFTAVGDFNRDGKPDIALVGNGQLWILDGASGAIELGPVAVPGTGSGGPPTIADFDGDGFPEIGVAMATFYSVLKPDYVNKTIKTLWQTANHDLSSSVTGSTVFDFEGDGKAEVIYADECYLWVFDGKTGGVRFAASHTSFTGTEASLVADVDGDGHAEIVMVTNGADPSSAGWGCMDSHGTPDIYNGVSWVPGPTSNKSYRGIVVYGDVENSWVGSRTLWNEHTYHVSNICDDRDDACPPPNVYGSIPKVETTNWTLPWLDNFRQNVQDKGQFDAPDAVVSLAVSCTMPVVGTASVRNIGLAALPAGVDVGLFVHPGATDVQVGSGTTTHPLFPGQTEDISIKADASKSSSSSTFFARILVDPMHPTFHECDSDNDESARVKPACTH